VKFHFVTSGRIIAAGEEPDAANRVECRSRIDLGSFGAQSRGAYRNGAELAGDRCEKLVTTPSSSCYASANRHRIGDDVREGKVNGGERPALGSWREDNEGFVSCASLGGEMMSGSGVQSGL
jgi:hypothetical protein